MIAAVATMHVRADRTDEFEVVVRELEAQVAANEPDCTLYRVARDRTDPLIYRSMEMFRDQAAIDFHVTQDYFHTALAGMRACLSDTPSSVLFMDTLS